MVDCMIHLWYSAFLSSEHRSLIKRLVLPHIQYVVDKIQGKDPDSKHARTLTFGNCSLRIILSRAQWEYALKKLDMHIPAGTATSKRNEIVLARKDHIQRALFNQPGASKVAVEKFRRTGVLLSFGSSHAEYVHPNP